MNAKEEYAKLTQLPKPKVKLSLCVRCNGIGKSLDYDQKEQDFYLSNCDKCHGKGWLVSLHDK